MYTKKTFEKFLRCIFAIALISAIFILADHCKNMMPHSIWMAKDMPEYLKGIIIPENFAIDDFPATGSTGHKKDFEELHLWQDKRTQEECHAAYGQRHAKIQEFYPEYNNFFDSLGKEDWNFLHGTVYEASAVIGHLKDHYSRPRPFNADSSLEPCEGIGRLEDYSYPSGHAALAGLYEGIMIAIDPDNADKIKEYAWQACVNRVIAGVHHPSDIMAGYALGQNIFNEFAKNKDFAGMLEKLHKDYVRQKKMKSLMQFFWKRRK